MRLVRWWKSLLAGTGVRLGVASALLASSSFSFAGAWTQEAGHCQLILSSSYLETRQTFDKRGIRRKFESGGRFRQVLFGSYAECGLTRRNTLVLNLNAPLLLYSNQYGSSSSAGLGDVEVGFRRRFNSAESKWVVSGQVTTMFPAYPADRNPAPGNHQEDVEGRLLLGRSGRWAGHQVFWDAEAAYRYRAQAPADQFRADISAGFNLTRRVMIMGQAFLIQSLGNGDPFNSSNPNAQSDFDLYKTQVSAVLPLRRSLRLQVGWCDAIAGRNTGSGHTFLLGLWKSF